MILGRSREGDSATFALAGSGVVVFTSWVGGGGGAGWLGLHSGVFN